MTNAAVWSEVAALEVDFCVHVLVADGLRVPPFDAHPDGSGGLRALGLDESSWQSWFRRVVAAQQALSRQVRVAGDLTSLTPEVRAELAQGFDRAHPSNAWTGPEAVRERLRSLWAEYEPDGEAWRRQVGNADGPGDLTPRERHRLWRVVDQLRPRGSTLETYLVRYGSAVVDVHPPGTLVIGLPAIPTFDDYQRLLREGIARLENPTR